MRFVLFFTESNNVKLKKILNLIATTLVFSLFWLLVAYCLKYKLSLKDTISYFLPVSLGNNWFVTCYIMIYICHPLLNLILTKLEKNKLFLLAVICESYLLYNFLITGMFYYTPFMACLCLYIIVGFIRKYTNFFENQMDKTVIPQKCGGQRRIIYLGVLGWVVLTLITNIIGLRIGVLSGLVAHWNKLTNPFLFLIALGLLGLAINREVFSNSFINKISGLTLYMYLFHDNPIVHNYIWNDIFGMIPEDTLNSFLILCVVVIGLLTFVISLVISFIYKTTLNKIMSICCNKMESWILAIYSKLKVILIG